jgi:hypothetical protein
MCRSSNKFKVGRLVFFHQRGVAAVIGQDCAAHETSKAANREWQLREQRKQEENYLLEVLPQLPRRFQTVGKAMAVCEEAQGFLRV